MTAIEYVSVGFSYPGGVRALADVSLRIDAGEQVALVGQNGSGKTTLARQLNGLLKPSQGKVMVDDHDTRQTRIAQLAAVVGLTFQDPDRQIFAGSVEAEVSFGPRNVGLAGDELEAAVAAALDAVGLASERKTNPYDLGYTRRKLLGIASVLAMRTPVVVLDEPTTGQDLRGRERVQAIIAALAAQGRTVITITHDMELAAESFARVVVMREGRIVLDGPPTEVFAAESWPILRTTKLEPTFAAQEGARRGLRSTPTIAALALALRADGA